MPPYGKLGGRTSRLYSLHLQLIPESVLLLAYNRGHRSVSNAVKHAQKGFLAQAKVFHIFQRALENVKRAPKCTHW